MALYEHHEYTSSPAAWPSWKGGGGVATRINVTAGSKKLRRFLFPRKGDAAEGPSRHELRSRPQSCMWSVIHGNGWMRSSTVWQPPSDFHFISGEVMQPPARQVTTEELSTQEPLTVVVSHEEDRALLNAFLETVYLEWPTASRLYWR